jgi:hypothetical protein
MPAAPSAAHSKPALKERRVMKLFVFLLIVVSLALPDVGLHIFNQPPLLH